MNELLAALLEQSFMQHALIGGLLASIGCGIIGPFVVVKRIGYLAGGIAHTALGGMGIAYFLDAAPLGGALIAAVLAGLLIGWVSLRWQQQEDMLIGAVWAVGMAIGVIFISQSPGYNVDLMSYLFGNILMVSRNDVYLMLGLDAAIVAVVGLFYKQLLAVCFDEEFARLRGVRVDFFYLLLLTMVALTVVLLIQVVGLILVIALLTLPAAVAGQWVGSLAKMMALAVVLGALFTTGGLAVAYRPDLPAGATIILFAGIVYILSTAGTGAYQRWRLRRRMQMR